MSSQKKNWSKRRKGNILKYTLPGLQNEIEIPFPDRKLPVCARCKKIYKTRELCRIRDGHTDVAWNTTHLCVSLDDSCFAQTTRGDLCLVDESTMKFVASTLKGPVIPYRTKKSDTLLPDTPICMACKQKNYTRNHCRDKQKHRQLPWGTVYVVLSAVPLPTKEIEKDDDIDSPDAGTKRNSPGAPTSPTMNSKINDSPLSKRRRVESNESRNIESTSDSIWDVAPSRSFLLTIMGKSRTLQWLQVDPMVSGPSQLPYCSDHAVNNQMPPAYAHPVQDPGVRYSPQGEWNDYHGYSHPYPCEPHASGWQYMVPPQQQSYHQYPHEYRHQDHLESHPDHDGLSPSPCYQISEVRQGPDEWCDNGYHSNQYSSESVNTQHSDPRNYTSSPYLHTGQPYDNGPMTHYECGTYHQNMGNGNDHPGHYPNYTNHHPVCERDEPTEVPSNGSFSHPSSSSR
eukprot:CAMPEP_0198250954 /NCGR_PEP_ID=MMETSP1447-20131203/1949_1 /TAXON_ID=420782 /ORGANISM="Chaetoceros dichaeta, Strain CCMP1751" /LENGTH=454 /DNA_ID=CAMNT_0043935871 /DNA_START=128 /DNA_END=1492 /DNA_ORIENTATION=-